MDSQPRILIVPGASVLLQRVAQKLDSRPHVSMLNTANTMLWHLRRSPATHVFVATELDDFDVLELADIVPALDPNTQLILCGPETPELAHAARQPNVELISSVHGLLERLQELRLSPPLPPSNTPSDPAVSSAWSGRRTTSSTTVLDAEQMVSIERTLRDLSAEILANAALVSDLAGMTIAQVGQVPAEAAPLYTPLLGTLFSAGAELGYMFAETHGQRLYIHGGIRHQVYALAIDERFILSVIRVSGIMGGTQQPVLAAMQRTVRELGEGFKL